MTFALIMFISGVFFGFGLAGWIQRKAEEA